MLFGSRAATVAIIIKGSCAAYGVARCQWRFQFCRKLAREVAIGRAKQAMGTKVSPMDWMEKGRSEPIKGTVDAKDLYATARKMAVGIIRRISTRAIQNGWHLEDQNFVLDKGDAHS